MVVLVPYEESSVTLTKPAYAEHAITDAEEFLRLLIPLRRSNCFAEMGQVIYRGVGKASYELEPSALRSTILASHGRSLAESPAVSAAHREWGQLRDFVDACDRTGIPVPTDSAELRRDLREFPDSVALGRVAWPLRSHWQLWGAAQHHGMPTRLLDWTRQPLVAIYFAAEQAISQDGEEPLAVWALALESINLFRSQGEAGLQIVTLPGATSPNLAAQSGLFTLVTERLDRTAATWTPATIQRVLERRLTSKPVLHKVTLPRACAPELLEACERMGVTASTLFPGMDGAAREVRVRKLRFSEKERFRIALDVVAAPSSPAPEQSGSSATAPPRGGRVRQAAGKRKR